MSRYESARDAWRLKLEPAITPLFRVWQRLRRSTTLGVRGLACDEHGRVLLVRHTYTPGWHLPGGGVERGETAYAAVLREMEEEGGVRALAPPRLVGFYANHANFPNDHVVLFRIETWNACAPLENGEIAERGFFTPHALPSETTPGTRRRLHEALGGGAPSAQW